ncbi:MAG: CapA family protein [Chloroflexi bacterium]|nr:CapA family protein [Chloroflexota bacterium]
MEKLSIYAVGDVIPDYPTPETLFELALPTLKKADILFGQLEVNLSETGGPQGSIPTQSVSGVAHTTGHRGIPPERVSGLTYAGFDVMSFASNHTLNRGEQPFFETVETLTRNNIAVIGVGRNIEEARKPLILERKGTRVGFLAYCSVVPNGREAGPGRPGCAPMRASTTYEQVDWQPGTPPRIITLANKDDLAAMVADIRKLRPQVDVVVMSIHWGVHLIPAVIAMYQKEVACAAIDAGVDLILGHHAHLLKAIEVYKGKAIFYSLGNFAMPNRGRPLNPFKKLYGIKADTEYDYAYPADARKSMLATCIVSNKKIERVSYLPLMINKHAQPEVLPRSDKRSAEVFDYMEWCCRDQGINTTFSWRGDEVVVSL